MLDARCQILGDGMRIENGELKAERRRPITITTTITTTILKGDGR
jgi:hypothetical protein